MLALYVLLPWEPQRVAWRVTSVEFLPEMREISGHLNTKPCSNPTQTETSLSIITVTIHLTNIILQYQCMHTNKTFLKNFKEH